MIDFWEKTETTLACSLFPKLAHHVAIHNFGGSLLAPFRVPNSNFVTG